VDDELIGATLGGCQLTALLGQGGMAKVYRGHQERLSRDVAVKVLPPSYVSDVSFIERFQREARAMAQLRHPNIVTIFDAGRQRDHLFIVMELVTGGNLRERLQAQMSFPEVDHVFNEVAAALAYAHEHGIVHRDVKPVNVLLDPVPEAFPRAVLTDFGIAKVLQTSAQLTRTGVGVGTPEYMSPEQCKGAAVDHRADIYALGVLLYEMFCGRPPFIADEYTAVAHSHIYEPVPTPTLFNPQVPAAVQMVIMRALQKRPEQRYQSAREMAAALHDALNPSPLRAPSRPITLACPQCQAPNPAGMNFCAKCGANLRGGPSAQAPTYLGLELPSVTCLNCGTRNPGFNRYCVRCGTRLATLICPNCGRPNASGRDTCAECGQPLGG
jgi:serine/threonine-protein kinase